jgi:hypothetical protein
MRTTKPLHSSEDSRAVSVIEFESDGQESAEEDWDAPLAEGVRVTCPECAKPISLGVPGEALPQHALCPTPWNPFGLTVCPGSGRAVADDGGLLPGVPTGGVDTITLVALPESLDWRLQPFSHVGGPDTRPMQVRQAA